MKILITVLSALLLNANLYAQAQAITKPMDSVSFTHYIGERYEGGIVVSVWKINNVEHGLIASLKDLSTEQVWSNIDMKLVGEAAQNLRNGQANTTAIINQTGHQSSAALICDQYVSGSFSDWYLPAAWELNQLYNAALIVNEVLGDTNGFQRASYWSSTEFPDGSGAWGRGFGYGLANGNAKFNRYSVRAVRRF